MADRFARSLAIWLATTTTALMLAGAPANASSSDGIYAQKGAGTLKCEQFVAERKARSNLYLQFRGWLDGYITHYNKATPDTTDVLSWQTTDLADLLLANFCTKNPQQSFSFAVDSLTKALHPTRLRNTSDVVDIPNSDPPIQLYKAIIRRIQQNLTERGLYKGEIDGAYGPGTAAAIKAFQANSKLKETGVPDQITLLRLFQ